MGDQHVTHIQSNDDLRRFTRQLIQDVRALEYMIEEGLFDTGTRRIGAEQELFLVDRFGSPAPIIEELLEINTHPDVVSELTRFNAEFNLDPLPFGGDALSKMEAGIEERLAYVRGLAGRLDADVVMCGILPTLALSDLTLDNLTPKPRYFALNDAIQHLRGGAGQIQIRGTDELMLRHEGMMLEGANTSFQTHFQVDPGTFAPYYNIAQAVAAPVLAAACNSPLLFGRSLWHETRIALFQQAVDTRSANVYLREMSPRVHFGSGWVKKGVAELYKEDIARFRVLLAPDSAEEDPFAVLARGETPRLRALSLHNGTVYRWNRAVYGVADGTPHLRIENRILPSGPSVPDEVANAAFWFGLVSGMALRYGDVRQHLRFSDVKANFISAARLGLGARLSWMDGLRLPAPELIEGHLLPIAHEGLEKAGIADADRERFLGIIADRVRARVTGAQWHLDSLAQIRDANPTGSSAECMAALVAAAIARQKEGRPVHEWPLAEAGERTTSRTLAKTRVEHFMTTDLFTVHEDEIVDLVACLMDWQRIRHVLVEDEEHRLVGLVSHRSLLRYMTNYRASLSEELVPVRQIMVPDPITVTPETPTRDAIRLMRAHAIGSLPVVREGHLVGIVTERDFIEIAGEILDGLMEEEAR